MFFTNNESYFILLWVFTRFSPGLCLHMCTVTKTVTYSVLDLQFGPTLLPVAHAYVNKNQLLSLIKILLILLCTLDETHKKYNTNEAFLNCNIFTVFMASESIPNLNIKICCFFHSHIISQKVLFYNSNTVW